MWTSEILDRNQHAAMIFCTLLILALLKVGMA